MAQPPGFFRSVHELVCDNVPLSAIADSVGTPLYVYSAAAFRARYAAIDDAFGDYPHRLHYALKANSSLAIVRLMRAIGSAVDANSIREIELARMVGIAPGDIVFTGVGKTMAELECAVPMGLKAINAESAGEIDRLEAIASRLGRVVRIAIRVNPDIDAKSHPHISTGRKINKFGVPLETARELLASIGSRSSLALVAIHLHVGSQITTIDPLARAAVLAAELTERLRGQGVALEYLDLGGGLGITYDAESVPSMRQYAAALVDAVRPTGLPIVVEPGRAIAGPAGVLVARVIDVKPRNGVSDFAVLDAGMTELMRPALYGAYHRIEPVVLRTAGERQYEIVGPVCESSDVLGRDRTLPALAVGDLVAIRDCGAYGSAMASNYNRRPLPPEVLVDNGEWRVIRKRQSLTDMLALET
ncbi:MAG TPA: diaminopimelate decarboxylase [Vicinamibacterales bacterium]